MTVLIGENLYFDMARMAEDPKTKEWWALCKPLQTPMVGTSSQEWWTTIPEIFHTD